MALVVGTLLSGKFRSQFDTLDNDLLGIKTLDETALEARIAAVLGVSEDKP